MARVNTWLTSAATGTTNSDQILPTRSVVVPAGGTLMKWMLFATVTGVQTTTTGYNTVGPLQWFVNITFDSTWYGLGRQIALIRTVLPSRPVALYDVPTAQRVYTHYHAGGSETLGGEGRTSWGGPGKPLLTLKAGAGTTKMDPAQVTFPLKWDLTFRALYLAP